MTGKKFIGYFRGDASTATAMSLYRASVGGAQTSRSALTLGANEVLVITDGWIVASAAATVDVFEDLDADGAMDAGELVFGGAFGANGGIAVRHETPHECKAGLTPKVKSSTADSVTAMIRGYIVAGG